MKLDFCKDLTEHCNQFATTLQELHNARAKCMQQSARVLKVFSEIKEKVHFTEEEHDMVTEANDKLTRNSGTY
jgi:hypothetical protein